MNLSDMLGYADIGQLNRIAGAYQCQCDGHSKHELIQSILQAVGRRELFDRHLTSMPLEDLRFLQSILFDEQNAFSLEELTARVKQSRFESIEARSGGFRTPPPDNGVLAARIEGGPPSPGSMGRAGETAASVAPKRGGTAKRKSRKPVPAAEPPSPRDTVVRFKQAGWLFNGISGTNRYLFHVPSDMKLRFREALYRKFAAGTESAEEPERYREEQGLMAADLRCLLRFAEKGETPLSADGILYRRDLQLLLDLFAVREEIPDRNAWRFGYGRRFKTYPDRLALLYDYAHSRKWISEEGMRLTLTSAGNEVLSGDIAEEPDELCRFWLRLYRRAVPNLPALLYWTNRLAPDWVTADSIGSVLVPFVKPFYYDAPETVFRLRVAGMMVHLGLLAVGSHASGGQTLRMTETGKNQVERLVRLMDR